MGHEICDYYVQSIIMNLRVRLGKLWLHIAGEMNSVSRKCDFCRST